jgi:hypothetical protein
MRLPGIILNTNGSVAGVKEGWEVNLSVFDLLLSLAGTKTGATSYLKSKKQS